LEIKDIKPGAWYDTKHGVGQAEPSPRTYPATVRIRIYSPSHLGLKILSPREVKAKIPAPSPLPAGATVEF
jgi:hypothetical protein